MPYLPVRYQSLTPTPPPPALLLNAQRSWYPGTSTMTSTEAATTTVEADTANLNMSPSRRPNDVALTQQRMKTWQPLLSPRWVIAAYFIIAVIFIPAGELFALKIQRK